MTEKEKYEEFELKMINRFVSKCESRRGNAEYVNGNDFVLDILARDYLARKKKDAESPIPISQINDNYNNAYHPSIQKAAKSLYDKEDIEKVLNDFFFEMEGVTNYLTNDKRGIWNHAVDNLRNRLIRLNEKDGR